MTKFLVEKETIIYDSQDFCLRKFQGAHKAKNREVKEPTREVLGTAAKS